MSKEIEEKISQEEIKYHIGLVDDFIKLAKRRIVTCKIVMAFHFVAILCYVFTRNLNSVATLFDVIQVSILIILTNYSFDNFNTYYCNGWRYL